MANNALVDGNYALITRSQRVINDALIPDVMIEEVATDTLRITDHPVEIGAAVSDHAFKLPVEIIMRCGFSDSRGGFEGYSRAVYSYLTQLQNERKPFNVSTPFRTYTNMLIEQIVKTNDEATSHAIMLVVAMREVIITNTSVTPNPSTNSGQLQLPAITVPPLVQQYGASNPSQRSQIDAANEVTTFKPPQNAISNIAGGALTTVSGSVLTTADTNQQLVTQ